MGTIREPGSLAAAEREPVWTRTQKICGVLWFLVFVITVRAVDDIVMGMGYSDGAAVAVSAAAGGALLTVIAALTLTWIRIKGRRTVRTFPQED